MASGSEPVWLWRFGPEAYLAARREDGIDAVVDAIDTHRAHLTDSGRLAARRGRYAVASKRAATLPSTSTGRKGLARNATSGSS